MGELVNECPTGKKDWEDHASQMTGCNSPYSYHCLQDSKGDLREICIERTRIGEGYCPILTSSKRFKWENCTLHPGCPTSRYVSDEVYQYLVCYKKIFSSGSTTQSTDSSASGDDDSTNVAAIVAPIVIVLVLLVIAAVMYKRNMFGVGDWINRNIVNRCRNMLRRNRAEEGTEGVVEPFLNIQGTPQQGKRGVPGIAEKENIKKSVAVKKLYSLVLFLPEIPVKRNINIDKMKQDITFLYEKSFQDLNEDQLQSLRSGDLKTLPSSMVYTIVTNLCNFEKPTRGWDNPPLKSDESLEGDIARIRSLWNNMCDGQMDQLLQMVEGTYHRMRDHFGEIGLAGDEETQKAKKVKIMWKQLNPDCVVDGEVVLTEKIKEISKKLEAKGLAVCTGVIGSGKSVAMKYIAEKYRKKGWKVVWREQSLSSTDVEVKQGEKVLVCCDNMFGGVGYECCASEELERVKNLLDNCLQDKRVKEGELKLLLSIQKHVLEEFNKEKCVIKVLKNFNYRVDIDESTTAELYLIFNETRKRGCESHPADCWYTKTEFSYVQTILEENEGLVGNPFLLMTFAMIHTFFTDKKFPKNPVGVFVLNFDRLKDEEPKSFYTLIYILFVKEHQKNTELKKWAQKLPTPLKREEVEEIGPDIAAYLHSEGEAIRISHEIFQIALFQSVAKTEEGLNLMLNFCELESILSISRPKGAKEEFSVELMEKDIEILANRDDYRDLISKSNHPFKKIKFKETLKD